MQTAVSAPALGSRAEKRAFYQHALKITLPIALQNFMDAAISSGDIIVLSFVSQSALAASSLAGQVAFVLQMLLFGISSGASVLAAQYWGKGDRHTVERVLGLSLRISLLVGLIFALATGLFPELVMRIYTSEASLIAPGIEYLRAASLSYVLGSFTTVYLSVMRSVERVRMSAAVHCSAAILNLLLNICFVFGLGPFPMLGVFGVALATTITRALETLVCLIDGSRCTVIRLRLQYLFTRAGALMRDFIRFAVPAAANDIIWGMAFSVYSMIFGRLSPDIVAANSVASVVRNLGTVVCFGVSSSAAIILGKVMGDNRMDEARVYASRFARLSVYTALVGGLVILAIRPLTLRFMNLFVRDVTALAQQELSIMLLINSYYIMGASVNTMLICGIFRAGGDVNFGMICDFFAMWAYAVPVGLLCAFVFKLPEMWVYFVLCLDEFVKMPVIIYHYKKRGWLRNVTRENA